ALALASRCLSSRHDGSPPFPSLTSTSWPIFIDSVEGTLELDKHPGDGVQLGATYDIVIPSANREIPEQMLMLDDPAHNFWIGLAQIVAPPEAGSQVGEGAQLRHLADPTR